MIVQKWWLSADMTSIIVFNKTNTVQQEIFMPASFHANGLFVKLTNIRADLILCTTELPF